MTDPEQDEPTAPEMGREPIVPESGEEVAFSPALEQLPAEQRRVIVQEIRSQLSHSGPLPPPEQLGRYEHVLPGLAERIVRLTEREQEQRHEIISFALKRDSRLRERGQALGMLALVLVLLFCVYLVATGSPKIAGGVAVGLVVAVVSIFVTGRRADLKELQHESAEAHD